MVQVAHSESLCSQFDRWVLELRKNSSEFLLVDVTEHDFTQQLGSDLIICHILTILYVNPDEAAQYGVVDRNYEAQPHEALAYEDVRKSFFIMPCSGRVLALCSSPLLTFFESSDIDVLSLDDYTDLPIINGIYDYVVCDGIVEQLVPHAIEAVYAALKPGGWILAFERGDKRDLIRKLLISTKGVNIQISGTVGLHRNLDSLGRMRPVTPAVFEKLCKTAPYPLFTWGYGRI